MWRVILGVLLVFWFFLIFGVVMGILPKAKNPISIHFHWGKPAKEKQFVLEENVRPVKREAFDDEDILILNKEDSGENYHLPLTTKQSSSVPVNDLEFSEPANNSPVLDPYRYPQPWGEDGR